MTENNTIDLARFYPDTMKILSQTITEESVILRFKSITHQAQCPRCGKTTDKYHSTYHRKVQDLPLFGKTVILDITAYRYYCADSECNQKVFAEGLQGFAGVYRRISSRLEELLITIALNTSCEGTAAICKKMGVRISADTVIKTLLRNADKIKISCGNVIGVDDWAYKKGHTYGTLICDGQTHKPVALLDGRDGSELKEWLKANQQVRIVTRDRASAYAKAISEVLPDAVQVADRFHLYQNLMVTVKESMLKDLPSRIAITDQIPDNEVPVCRQKDADKKNRVDGK